GQLRRGRARKSEVHQDQVRALSTHDVQGGPAVGCLAQPIGGALEEVADDSPIQLIVLDVQNSLRAHEVIVPFMRKGIEKEKVDPLPISLSAHTWPACISTNFLVMLRPSPVPPNSRAIVASAC